jgi:NAD(P)-dependent dehydrogenase (short-subunit alcohol dehydrogenase family)
MAIGVVPGAVKTELWDKMGQSKEQQEQTFEAAAKKLPVGFVATPEDVSESCARGETASDHAFVSVDCRGLSILPARRLCKWDAYYD